MDRDYLEEVGGGGDSEGLVGCREGWMWVGQAIHRFKSSRTASSRLFSRLAGRASRRKLVDVIRSCSYRGDPLFFSMWCCLLADKGMDKVTSEWLEQNIAHVRKALHQYRAKHNLWPHPAVLVTRAADAAP